MTQDDLDRMKHHSPVSQGKVFGGLTPHQPESDVM